jgi:hypothetical protein
MDADACDCESKAEGKREDDCRWPGHRHGIEGDVGQQGNDARNTAAARPVPIGESCWRNRAGASQRT